jgi:hypothetical protein
MLHDTSADADTPVQIGKLIYVEVAVSASARETVVSNKIIVKTVGMRFMRSEGWIIIN